LSGIVVAATGLISLLLRWLADLGKLRSPVSCRQKDDRFQDQCSELRSLSLDQIFNSATDVVLVTLGSWFDFPLVKMVGGSWKVEIPSELQAELGKDLDFASVPGSMLRTSLLVAGPDLQ
jgi:hypothetical protein